LVVAILRAESIQVGFFLDVLFAFLKSTNPFFKESENGLSSPVLLEERSPYTLGAMVIVCGSRFD